MAGYIVNVYKFSGTHFIKIKNKLTALKIKLPRNRNRVWDWE